MQIGIISSRYPVGVKHDAGRAVHSFANGLAELGHKVTVYTYNTGRMTMTYLEKKNLKIANIGILATIPIKTGLIYEDAALWNESIWDEIAHEDTTQLLLVFDWYGFEAAIRHRDEYKSVVVGVVGPLACGRGHFVPFTDAAKLTDFKEQELRFLTESDYLVSFNKCSESEVRKLTNVPVCTIPLGVTSHTDLPVLPVSSGSVLVVGRLSREKALEALLRSIKENYWVELTLCGTGADTDYGKYIAKLAAKFEVANRVVFTDVLPGELYLRAEMVICPSIYDPFAYQVYDAFNYAVPVIAHYMSYADIVKHSDTGFVYQSVSELSKAMNLLHHSKALRKQFSLAGKAEMLQHYTMQRSVERMDHLILQLTDGVVKA